MRMLVTFEFADSGTPIVRSSSVARNILRVTDQGKCRTIATVNAPTPIHCKCLIAILEEGNDASPGFACSGGAVYRQKARAISTSFQCDRCPIGHGYL
jgi:hypothetical protein